MFARTYGATTQGIDGFIIDVEVDVSAGLPGTDIVGMPDTAVRESKERVRTAIKNSGIRYAPQRHTINLAPADIKKDSSGLDLPMALGLLIAHGIISQESVQGAIFAAELSLEGELRGIHGILPMTIKAREKGFRKIFLAQENANEALLVEGIEVYAVRRLSEIVDCLKGAVKLAPAASSGSDDDGGALAEDDFADVQGQFQAKRAMEIAAAGGHNLLMAGSPGAGKTMLARRFPSILPAMTRAEALEVTKIYSIAGLLEGGRGLIRQRPFRSPHHTTSATAIIGGGSFPRPGEVTLSHHGVLFLDELPEFSKQTLEVLRQPIEDGRVTVSRVHASLTFPSQFILIAAMNPCPCGWQGDSSHSCNCLPNEIKRYTRRISGPLLDRIDIHIRVPRVEYKELTAEAQGEASAVIRQRVTAARKRQLDRFSALGSGIFCNGQMNHALLKKTCQLTPAAQNLLGNFFTAKHLSARSYDRIIKVGRTIADLAGENNITERHIAEAIQLRNDIGLDGDY